MEEPCDPNEQYAAMMTGFVTSGQARRWLPCRFDFQVPYPRKRQICIYLRCDAPQYLDRLCHRRSGKTEPTLAEHRSCGLCTDRAREGVFCNRAP